MSLEMKKELDKIINEYSDIFSKNQYDVSISAHPPLKYLWKNHHAYHTHIPYHSNLDLGQITPLASY